VKRYCIRVDIYGDSTVCCFEEGNRKQEYECKSKILSIIEFAKRNLIPINYYVWVDEVIK